MRRVPWVVLISPSVSPNAPLLIQYYIIFLKTLDLPSGEGAFYTLLAISIPWYCGFPIMPQKESEAVPEGNVSVPQQEEFGSGQPTLVDVCRKTEEVWDWKNG